MIKTQKKFISEVGTYADFETAVKVANSNNLFFKKTDQKNLFARVDKKNCKVLIYKTF